MKTYHRIIKLIETKGGRLSDSQRLKLCEVCLESALDQLDTDEKARNACADMLMHQRGIWQDMEYWDKKSREHTAKQESAA